MRRFWQLLALLLAVMTLGGCTMPADPLEEAVSTLVPHADTVLPLPGEEDRFPRGNEATLYFRYLDEPCLASETRAVASSASMPLERTLTEALIAGPGTSSGHLSGLFPAGTRVLSTVHQGRTIFVTFSKEILSAYPDEPAAWQEDAFWKTEVPLRRQLCMQALAATLTENCDADQVCVLVEQSAATDSLRLRRNYYQPGSSDTSPAELLTRRDDLLLTPDNSLQMILTLWQQRNWQRLTRYLLSGEDAAFTAQADKLPHLTDFAFTGPSISGNRATFTVQLDIPGTASQPRVMRLYFSGGLWKMDAHDLLSLTAEVSP